MKFNKLLIPVMLIFVGFNNPVLSQKLISVSDYGIKPNTHIDIAPMVKKLVDTFKNEKNVTLFFPEGRDRKSVV